MDVKRTNAASERSLYYKILRYALFAVLGLEILLKIIETIIALDTVIGDGVTKKSQRMEIRYLWCDLGLTSLLVVVGVAGNWVEDFRMVMGFAVADTFFYIVKLAIYDTYTSFGVFSYYFSWGVVLMSFHVAFNIWKNNRAPPASVA
ncbi:hypothetical protein HDE_07743 [Halotydeus destructor]|nr:hypothetical protein HDE_07743 [Halotydeus destructor]